LATITTQQIVSFIQNKIAETHAAGEDVVNLLANPEIAFSLQVLDSTYNKVKTTNDNKNTGTEQLYMAADTNTNNGTNQTIALHI
jgi:hypothetical protein